MANGGDCPGDCCDDEVFQDSAPEWPGRRELAARFMAAFAVNPALDPDISAAHVASDAVEWADALIKALGEDS
jgi:hypothetical protein